MSKFAASSTKLLTFMQVINFQYFLFFGYFQPVSLLLSSSIVIYFSNFVLILFQINLFNIKIILKFFHHLFRLLLQFLYNSSLNYVFQKLSFFIIRYMSHTHRRSAFLAISPLLVDRFGLSLRFCNLDFYKGCHIWWLQE